MIRLILFICLLAHWFAPSAFADAAKPAEKPAPAAPALKPGELTYEQMRSVLAGLRALDRGTQEIAKDGSVDHVIAHAFKLDPTIRERLGLLEARLSEAERTWQLAHDTLVRRFSKDGNGADVDPAQSAAFTAAAVALDADSSGVIAPHILIDDLRLKDNPDIAGGIIALLDPIIDRK